MTLRTIQWLEFNDAQDVFVVGLQNGLRVFNVEPLGEQLNLGLDEVGSVKRCSLLHRTNLMAVVGGGPRSRFADNTVLLWDDAKKRFCLEITFDQSILAVKLTYTKLIVCLQRRIHVFSASRPSRRLGTFETRDNPRGLFRVSIDPHRALLVFPGHKIGSVEIADLNELSDGSSMAPVNINAHQTEIACLALNAQGTLLATGSILGTMIRLYSVKTKALLAGFRRGSDPATLHCLTFSPDSAFLCVSSDKGTVHIFAVRDKDSNKRTILQQVGLVTEESRRSLAQFALPSDSPAICAFRPAQSVIAICMDGTYHKFQFSIDGSCSREEYDNFLDLGDDRHFWTQGIRQSTKTA